MANRGVYLRFTPMGVLHAYREGIFPMADEQAGSIFWFRPDPRAVLPLDGFHCSRSLARKLRRNLFEVRVNTCFEEVMRGCADRPEGTWISDSFLALYTALHREGFAHSVEVFQEDQLVGGTYGVALGAAFMAESMFHRVTDASKVAVSALVDRLAARKFDLLDVQYVTPHLQTLGAIEIPHAEYYERLQRAVKKNRSFDDHCG